MQPRCPPLPQQLGHLGSEPSAPLIRSALQSTQSAAQRLHTGVEALREQKLGTAFREFSAALEAPTSGVRGEEGLQAEVGPRLGSPRCGITFLGGCMAFWTCAFQDGAGRVRAVRARLARLQPGLGVKPVCPLRSPLATTQAALGRSAVALKMRRPKLALLDAKSVREARPDDPRGAVAEGLAHMSLKSYKWALECFERAAELEPDYPGGWVGRWVAGLPRW